MFQMNKNDSTLKVKVYHFIKSVLLMTLSLSLCACGYMNKNTQIYFSIIEDDCNSKELHVNTYVDENQQLENVAKTTYNLDWPESVYSKESSKLYYTKSQKDGHSQVYEKNIKTGKEKVIFQDFNLVKTMYLLNNQKLLVVGENSTSTEDYCIPCIVDLNDYSVDYGNWKKTDVIHATYYNPKTDEISFAYYDINEEKQSQQAMSNEAIKEYPLDVKICIYDGNSKKDIYNCGFKIKDFAYDDHELVYRSEDEPLKIMRYDFKTSQKEDLGLWKLLNADIDVVYIEDNQYYLILNNYKHQTFIKYDTKTRIPSTIFEVQGNKNINNIKPVSLSK